MKTRLNGGSDALRSERAAPASAPALQESAVILTAILEKAHVIYLVKASTSAAMHRRPAAAHAGYGSAIVTNVIAWSTIVTGTESWVVPCESCSVRAPAMLSGSHATPSGPVASTGQTSGSAPS
jgi:hypothetical protein